MSDYLAFIDSIIANPSCNLVRLVFADWLDEHGDSEFAAEIREAIASGTVTRHYMYDAAMNAPTSYCDLRFGFRWKVHCSFQYWLQSGPCLLALHPVEFVTVYDAERVPAHAIPYEIWCCLPGNSTEYCNADAEDAALSLALIRWARAKQKRTEFESENE